MGQGMAGWYQLSGIPMDIAASAATASAAASMAAVRWCQPSGAAVDPAAAAVSAAGVAVAPGSGRRIRGDQEDRSSHSTSPGLPANDATAASREATWD